jgi:hypothetical protein
MALPFEIALSFRAAARPDGEGRVAALGRPLVAPVASAVEFLITHVSPGALAWTQVSPPKITLSDDRRHFAPSDAGRISRSTFPQRRRTIFVPRNDAKADVRNN